MVLSKTGKKVIWNLAILFIITSFLFYINIENLKSDREDEEQNILTFDEIIENQINDYNKNLSYYQAYKIKNYGLDVVFGDTNYLHKKFSYYKENNRSVFGLHSSSKEILFVNVETISNYGIYTNLTQEEIKNKIKNTLKHEALHIIEDELNYNNVYFETLEKEIDFEKENQIYQKHKQSIPKELRLSVDFNTILLNNSFYDEEDYLDEIIVRKMALCWREYNGDYTGIYDILVFADEIDYCSNSLYTKSFFGFNQNDARFNTIITYITEAYKETFIEGISKEIRIDKNTLEETFVE